MGNGPSVHLGCRESTLAIDERAKPQTALPSLLHANKVICIVPGLPTSLFRRTYQSLSGHSPSKIFKPS